MISNEKTIQVDPDFLGLFFNLNNPITYALSGMEDGIIPGMHYGLVWVPSERGAITLYEGWNDFVSMKLDVAILEMVIKDYPLLKDFLTKSQDHAVSLSNRPLSMTREITAILSQIVDDEYAEFNKLSQLRLSLKGPELLAFGLQRIHAELLYQ